MYTCVVSRAHALKIVDTSCYYSVVYNTDAQCTYNYTTLISHNGLQYINQHRYNTCIVMLYMYMSYDDTMDY